MNSILYMVYFWKNSPNKDIRLNISSTVQPGTLGYVFHIYSPHSNVPTIHLYVFSSHSSWISSSLDVQAEVTQEEGHTGFFIHLPSAVRALYACTVNTYGMIGSIQ